MRVTFLRYQHSGTNLDDRLQIWFHKHFTEAKIFGLVKNLVGQSHNSQKLTLKPKFRKPAYSQLIVWKSVLLYRFPLRFTSTSGIKPCDTHQYRRPKHSACRCRARCAPRRCPASRRPPPPWSAGCGSRPVARPRGW